MKNKIETEQEQHGRAKAIAMTAQQGTCCMILKSFADCASPALPSRPPSSSGFLLPVPVRQGLWAQPWDLLRECPQQREGVTVGKCVPSPELWMTAWFAQGPAAGAAWGWGMLWFTETERAGGLNPAPVGGGEQKLAVFWLECGILALLCSKQSCPMWVVIKDLLFIINERGVAAPASLFLKGCCTLSCKSVENCFYECGIKSKQSYLKSFPIGFTDHKIDTLLECCSTNHFRFYFRLSALHAITIYSDIWKSNEQKGVLMKSGSHHFD